jgi:hypothetical protein
MQFHITRKTVQLALVVAVAAVAVIAALPSAAQDTPAAEPPRTITVTGIGSASGTPDQAILTLGVELRSDDLGAVVNDVNTTIAGVIDALVAAGIAPEDIQTVNFSVYQEIPPMAMDATTSEQIDYTYVVSNMVNVRVRDTSQLNTIIDAGLAAGANRIFGLTFGLQDQTALQNAALENAVADANSRAETLANTLGVTLGEAITVREVAGYSPYPREAAMAIGGGGGSISEGQLSVTAQVEITYSIQ